MIEMNSVAEQNVKIAMENIKVVTENSTETMSQIKKKDMKQRKEKH